MTEPKPIIIPLINPNEPGALLAAIHVTPRQRVVSGEKLCTLETTKSTLELNAESDGYIVGVTVEPGQIVQAGDILGYIADSADWIPPAASISPIKETPSIPEGLRISQPALQLAQLYNLDLADFSQDVFVTEKMVRERIDIARLPEFELQLERVEPNSIIIYGGGGHGKALIDLIRIVGTHPIAGLVDDGLRPGAQVMGFPVLGGANILKMLVEKGIHLAANAVGGIGNISSRISVFERLSKAGFTFPPLIHPAAFIEPGAILADGVQVMPLAYVGSEAQVGFGAIINTGAIVSHDCVLGDYCNLSPGAILAGEVNVGDATLIGMGVTVNLRVKIGHHARIGNGATVKQDVPDQKIVHAGTIWPG